MRFPISSSVSGQPTATAIVNSQAKSMEFKSPKRISITIPSSTYEMLLTASEEQGRSISNLAAYLLESSLKNKTQTPKKAEKPVW
jgi:CopG-like RHH_1 or ribbon-helix-helix domain, RHH_5